MRFNYGHHIVDFLKFLFVFSVRICFDNYDIILLPTVPLLCLYSTLLPEILLLVCPLCFVCCIYFFRLFMSWKIFLSPSIMSDIFCWLLQSRVAVIIFWTLYALYQALLVFKFSAEKSLFWCGFLYMWLEVLLLQLSITFCCAQLEF